MAYIAKFLDRFKDYGSLYIQDALPLAQHNNSLSVLYHLKIFITQYIMRFFVFYLYTFEQSEESML